MDSQDRERLKELFIEAHENNKGWDILEEMDFSAGQTPYWGYNLATDVMEGYRDTMLDTIAKWLDEDSACDCDREALALSHPDDGEDIHYINCPADALGEEPFDAEDWKKEIKEY